MNEIKQVPALLVKNQEKPIKKGKKGGPRPNSGRPKGTTNKLSAVQLLNQISIVDVPFEVGFAEDYASARRSGDKYLVQKYQAMILNKVVADKVDVTSNGETVTVGFSFPKHELEDWK
jgi:hypothetical protein